MCSVYSNNPLGCLPAHTINRFVAVQMLVLDVCCSVMQKTHRPPLSLPLATFWSEDKFCTKLFNPALPCPALVNLFSLFSCAAPITSQGKKILVVTDVFTPNDM